MEQTKIALVDDQHLFRQGIASLVRSIPEFNLMLEAENGEDFLNTLYNIKEELPHIALIDLEMPIMDGIALNENIQRKYPNIKVIILSGHSRERLIARMIREGASGYLLKNCDKDELILAIRAVKNTGFYINANSLKAIQNFSPKTDHLTNINGIPIDLSVREKEVLQLVCQEFSNAEIAQKLYLSPRTVEGHRNNLLQKIGCRNTAGLVIFAVKSHIYNLPF